MKPRKILAIVPLLSLAFPLSAQEPSIEKPRGEVFLRPYKQPTVGPVILTNSDRLRSLIRAGRLYLTVQDAIALAIENNLDLQIDRYGPLNAQANLETFNAGGPLKGVTSASAAVNTSTNGQGANGGLTAAGISSFAGTGGGATSNSTISQIGPITPNLDPVFQNTSVWSHTTTPESNVYYYGTASLVDVRHTYNSYVTEGLLTGGNIQIQQNESYLNENSPFDSLNPSVYPRVYFTATQNLLQGFGIAMNARFIHIGQKQVGAAAITFRSQLTTLVQNVVNVYWDLVASQQDLAAKQQALRESEQFNDDTRRQVQLGVIAGVDAYRAAADLSSRQQDVLLAQETVEQQVTQIKGMLSRTGLADPLLDSAEVVTLDSIAVPATDDVPPLRQLLAIALEHRSDVQLDQINDEISRLSALGTTNNLLPQLRVSGSTTNRGVAGSANPEAPQPAPPYAIGGLGNALGQIFRHDYTTRQGTVVFQASIGNHLAQGDYGIDQLQLRQSDLTERKNRNDMLVAISNDMIALRQARARYMNAVATRQLQQDLLEKERQKFSLGSSTIDLVIQAERALSAAQYTEIAALSTYGHSRAALDQVLGMTLETYHVSVDQALKGSVERQSNPPATNH